jgi:hypothetical protein
MPEQDEIEAATRKVIDDAAGLVQQLATASSDPDDWFRNLLHGILKCSLEDYGAVQKGVQGSMYEAAWGKRNLLELRVITAYVLGSRANATEFKHQLIHDARMFYDALSTLQELTHKQLQSSLAEFAAQPGPWQTQWEEALKKHEERGPQNQHLEEEAESYRQVLKDLGLESTPFKRTKQMAADQGEAVRDELDAINTICSKLLHRTALSIASATRDDSLAELGPLLSTSSFSDVLLIYDSIKTHIARYGFHPPD